MHLRIIQINPLQPSKISSNLNATIFHNSTSIYKPTCDGILEMTTYHSWNINEFSSSWLHCASTVLNTFYYQLMHITLKNAELLKHSKLDKNAPTCFGLHRNHLQGAKVSAWLKNTRLVDSICVKDVQGVVSAMAAYCDCNKGYVCNIWIKIQTNKKQTG